MKEFIEGRNPIKYITKIEADANSTTAEIFFYSPKEAHSFSIKKGFTKFIFMRDLDMMSKYASKALQKAKSIHKKASDAFDGMPELERQYNEIAHQIKQARKDGNELDVLIESRERLKKDIDKTKARYEDANSDLASAKKAVSNCHSLPTMQSFIKGVQDFCKKKRLGSNGIVVEKLKIEHDHYRLNYGYTYIIKTNDYALSTVHNALEHAGLPIKGKGRDLADSLKIFLAPKPFEMAYISTSARPFKGIDDYAQLNRMCIDLETTSLHAMTANCIQCNKAYPMTNEHDLPQNCSCGSDEFVKSDTGQIFMASVVQGDYKKVYIAKKDDSDKVSNTEEKKLIESIFSDIVTKRPSVVIGYNSEAFDFGYLLIRSNRLGIETAPIQCMKCNSGYMGKSDGGHKCSSHECGNEITHEAAKKYYDSPKLYSKELFHWCPSCRKGNIVKGKTMYGCSNYEECFVRYSFDEYESIIKKHMRGLSRWTQTTMSEKHYAHKDKYQQSLKLGGDTENFRPTKIYGVNVLDTMQQVRKNRAINSSMPDSFNLKVMANFKPLKARKDRVLIKHEDIWKFYSDRPFLCSPDMVYKEIPEGFAPEEYLDICNADPSRLPDYGKSFYGPNKGYEPLEEENDTNINDSLVDEETTRGSYFDPVESLSDDELYGNISCADYYQTNKGKFFLISGKELLERYVMDDSIDTLAVDGVYTKERFLTGKYFPTNLDRFATMGVASAWNLLVMAWCYENGIAVPYQEKDSLPVGGLSRMWVRGVEDNIYKEDFASLYPSLILALDMYPSFAPYIKEILKYFYDMRMYYNNRKKLGDIDDLQVRANKYIAFLKEDGNEEKYDDAVRKYSQGGYDAISSDVSLYIQNADNIQLPCKININAIFGFLGSFVGLASDVMKACQVTSSGRMFLRSTIVFNQVFGAKALLCDTDGVNFSMPEYIAISLADFKPLETPIKLSDVEWGGKKGVNAIIARYNSLFLPYNTPMKLDSDGKYDRSFNAAKKNYINIDGGKVKFTGNSFKNSKTVDVVKRFFSQEAKEAITSGNLNAFMDKYYMYAESIMNGEIPVWMIAKKAKVRQTVEDYMNRGADKNGREKAKQAHMELLIANNIKANVGETVYYVNNGYKKSDKDSSMIDIATHTHDGRKVCKSCGSDWNGEQCEVEVKVKGGKNPVYAICSSKEFIEVFPFKCMNDTCNKKHELHKDEMQMSGDAYIWKQCGKTTKGIKCHCNEYAPIFTKTVTGQRPAAIIVSESVIKGEPMAVYEYNKEHYLEVFNNKCKPFQYLLPPQYRDFFMEQGKERIVLPEGIKFHSEPFDSIEEALTLEQKEIDFWNASGLNPLECVPVWWVAKHIKIMDFIPKWDLFNKVWLDISEKRPNMEIRPSKRMAKEGQWYMELITPEEFHLYKYGESKPTAIYMGGVWKKNE